MALNPNLLASFLSIPFTFNLLPLPLPSIPFSILSLSRQVRLVLFFLIFPTRFDPWYPRFIRVSLYRVS